MSEKNSPPARLSLREQEFLKSIVQMDLRATTAIAKESGLNQGSMMDAIAGGRSIRLDSLQSLLNTLAIKDSWMLDPNRPHLFKVNADLNPLHTVINTLGRCLLYWFPPVMGPSEGWDPETYALKSFFVIRSGEVLIVVDRDPWRVGRGKRPTVEAKDAKALTPSNVDGLQWAGGSAETARIDIPMRNRLLIDRMFRIDSDIDKTELMQLLFPDVPAITWDDVISEASAAGLSPAEVLAAVKKLAANVIPS